LAQRPGVIAAPLGLGHHFLLLVGDVLLLGLKMFVTLDELAQFVGGDGIGAVRAAHAWLSLLAAAPVVAACRSAGKSGQGCGGHPSGAISARPAGMAPVHLAENTRGGEWPQAR